MSRLSGNHYQKSADLYSGPTLKGQPYRVCANTVKKHIIEANGIPTDIFQHSWNPELATGFRRSYLDPPFNQYVANYTGLFENNLPYEEMLRSLYNGSDWSQARRFHLVALSLSLFLF